MNDGALLLFSIILSRLKNCQTVWVIFWNPLSEVLLSVTGSLEQWRRWTRTVHRRTNSRFRIRKRMSLLWLYLMFELLTWDFLFDLLQTSISWLIRTTYCLSMQSSLSIWLSLLIYTYSYGWCRTLLTSITSKKVRLHLLYALLIHLCYWGAWAQVRTSSTKCCAPFEENVHSLWSFYKFLETQEINNERYYHSW